MLPYLEHGGCHERILKDLSRLPDLATNLAPGRLNTIRAVADAVVQTEQARLKAEALHELVAWAEANPEARTHDAGDCLTVPLWVIRYRAYEVSRMATSDQSTDQESER